MPTLGSVNACVWAYGYDRKGKPVAKTMSAPVPIAKMCVMYPAIVEIRAYYPGWAPEITKPAKYADFMAEIRAGRESVEPIAA